MKNILQEIRKTYTLIDITLLAISVIFLLVDLFVPTFIAVWIAYAWMTMVVLYATYSIYTYKNRKKMNNGNR